MTLGICVEWHHLIFNFTCLNPIRSETNSLGKVGHNDLSPFNWHQVLGNLILHRNLLLRWSKSHVNKHKMYIIICPVREKRQSHKSIEFLQLAQINLLIDDLRWRSYYKNWKLLIKFSSVTMKILKFKNMNCYFFTMGKSYMIFEKLIFAMLQCYESFKIYIYRHLHRLSFCCNCFSIVATMGKVNRQCFIILKS